MDMAVNMLQLKLKNTICMIITMIIMMITNTGIRCMIIIIYTIMMIICRMVMTRMVCIQNSKIKSSCFILAYFRHISYVWRWVHHCPIVNRHCINISCFRHFSRILLLFSKKSKLFFCHSQIRSNQYESTIGWKPYGSGWSGNSLYKAWPTYYSQGNIQLRRFI